MLRRRQAASHRMKKHREFGRDEVFSSRGQLEQRFQITTARCTSRVESRYKMRKSEKSTRDEIRRKTDRERSQREIIRKCTKTRRGNEQDFTFM